MIEFIKNYIFIIVALDYTLLIVDKLRLKKIKNITKNNTFYNNLSRNSTVKFSNSIGENLISTKNTFKDYILFPVLYCFPIIGQVILVWDIFKEIKLIKHYSTKEFVSKKCSELFYNDLENGLSDVDSSIYLIKVYSSKAEAIEIKNFLKNKNNIYHEVGLESYIKLSEIISEKNEQKKYMPDNEKLEIADELIELVNDYLNLIRTLSNHSCIKDTKAKDYSEFLKSITNDIQNKKY